MFVRLVLGDQVLGPFPDDLVEVDESRVDVVDRTTRGFECEEDCATTNEGFVIAVVFDRESGSDLGEELPFSARPLEDRLCHSVIGLLESAVKDLSVHDASREKNTLDAHLNVGAYSVVYQYKRVLNDNPDTTCERSFGYNPDR